jgi:hypothetical protein
MLNTDLLLRTVLAKMLSHRTLKMKNFIGRLPKILLVPIAGGLMELAVRHGMDVKLKSSLARPREG